MCEFKKLTREQFNEKMDELLTKETEQMKGWIDEITEGRLTFEDIEKAQTYEPYEDNRDELISDLIGWISEHIYKDEDLVEVLKEHTSITAEQLKEYVD